MTLIEVMVVMVIMAAMAVAAAIGVMRAWNTSKKHDTATRARTIQAAATAYLFEGGADCPTVDDLGRAGILDSTTEHTDGWGQAFTVECEETVVHVRSPGADAALGTEDDIGF
jgi:prepilin-type N-terminal cleavage/methylation domain-containing protein